VTAALGEQLSPGIAGQSSGRTALTFRAKAVIESNLHDHELNTEKVAALVCISPFNAFHASLTRNLPCLDRYRIQQCRTLWHQRRPWRPLR